MLLLTVSQSASEVPQMNWIRNGVRVADAGWPVAIFLHYLAVELIIDIGTFHSGDRNSCVSSACAYIRT